MLAFAMQIAGTVHPEESVADRGFRNSDADAEAGSKECTVRERDGGQITTKRV